MNKNITFAGILFSTVILLVGCEKNQPTTDEQQRQATERMVSQANQEVGMPDIVNWAERRNAKTILELRDKEITTYAYIVDMSGGLHFLGEAVGYGLPYSVQFTNPERIEYVKWSTGVQATTVPQPDPNGLFMPDGLSATWIMLRDPKSGEVRPVYVEPEIIVSPFPLEHVGSYQPKAEKPEQ